MRLHPLSIPYRALGRAASVATTLVFLAVIGSGLGRFGDPLALAGLVVVGVAVAVAWEVAYYRRFEYVLGPDTLEITAGVLSRRHREIPLRRIQTVDLRRDAVQRVLGIAAVSLETAGGGETEASLEYLGIAEARSLQREIRRRKAGEDAEAGEATELAGQRLFALSNADLLVVSVLSFDPRILTVLFFLLPVGGQVMPEGVVGTATLLVTVFGAAVAAVGLWAISAFRTFAQYYGFELRRVGDDLEYERGLFQRFGGSIPTDKVQSVTVRENALMRHFGYAALSVETAGYSPGGSTTGGSAAAVPLADRAEVLALARDVEDFGDPDLLRPPDRARQRYLVRYALAVLALTAVAGAVDAFLIAVGPWYAVPALLALVPTAASATWRHRGHAVGDDHVVTRNGFWRRQTRVVPYYRVQTVAVRETVFQRRRDLATVIVDTAGAGGLGGGNARAVDLDVDRAGDLAETVRERLWADLARRKRKRREEAADDQP